MRVDEEVLTIYEKTAIIILSALLLAGALVLHFRHSRPFPEIVIEKSGVKEILTMKEIERMLRENRMVDLNSASTDEIMTIPGIGEVLAGRIVDHKERYGRFRSAADILEVNGIGRKKLEKIREYLKFEG